MKHAMSVLCALVALAIGQPSSDWVVKVPQEFPSIQQAVLTHVQAKQRIVVEIAAGTYMENVLVPPEQNFLFRAKDKGTVTIDGGKKGATFASPRQSTLEFENLRLRNQI